MTDLVERLRVVPSAGQFLRLGDLVNLLVEERQEAAAELERLNKIVDAAKQMREGIRDAGVKRDPALYTRVMQFDAAVTGKDWFDT